jgi:hypothetical protein
MVINDVAAAVCFGEGQDLDILGCMNLRIDCPASLLLCTRSRMFFWGTAVSFCQAFAIGAWRQGALFDNKWKTVWPVVACWFSALDTVTISLLLPCKCFFFAQQHPAKSLYFCLILFPQ